MYCPKCNQQQASDEMRFCSRCGFPLTVVAHLLANNGVLEQLSREQNKKARSSRRKIMSEGAYLTLIAWLAALGATHWSNAGGTLEIATGIAIITFLFVGLIGLIRFVYGFLFVSDSVLPQSESLDRLIQEQAARTALPPQQSLPVSDYLRRADTKEMATRPSVTENTTRLLDEPPANRNE